MNTIADVSRAVLAHYGCRVPGHGYDAETYAHLAKNRKNVLLILFDGMGRELTESVLDEGAFLRRHTVKTVSSVFPPTTVAAVTSVMTGLDPVEHGWLGWKLYFEEAGGNVTAFGNLSEKTGLPFGDVRLADKHMPYVSIMDRIRACAPDVDVGEISPLNGSMPWATEEFARRIKKETERPGRVFRCCYWPNPDHLCHEFGTSSGKTARNIRNINKHMENLLRGLTDTAAIVIADHGMTDSEWIYLEEYPQIDDMLLREPSLESRCASLWIKDGMKDAFYEAFTREFGSRFRLMAGDEFLASGLLGTGTPHPMVRTFIGDFVVIAADRACLARRRKAKNMVGVHAGLTEREMAVPLILIDRE